MMRTEEKLVLIEDFAPEAKLMTGFDDCIIGLCTRFGMDTVVLYDRDKVLEKLVKREGMTYEEAVEFFEYNQIGAWVGEGTPAFAEIFD